MLISRAGVPLLRLLLAFLVLTSSLSAWPSNAPEAALAAGPCDPPIVNPIPCENTLAGSPESEWDSVGGSTIQGFATDISVNVGSQIQFKIKTDAHAYTIKIYRLGWYGGDGARQVAQINPSASLPQNQPACVTSAATEIYDCGTWAVSASWTVPTSMVSGVYIARLIRSDTNNDSHIPFVVRNDASHSPVQVVRPDLSPQYDTDPEQSARTRAALFDRIEQEGLKVAAGHYPYPGLGGIVRVKGKRRWQSLS